MEEIKKEFQNVSKVREFTPKYTVNNTQENIKIF